jgi:hypothetical protein
VLTALIWEGGEKRRKGREDGKGRKVKIERVYIF